jgi:hypothetical protein
MTVLRRSDFASKSKIPPKGVRAFGKIGELAADQVDAFCFHDENPSKARILSWHGRAISVRPELVEGLSPNGILRLNAPSSIA